MSSGARRRTGVARSMVSGVGHGGDVRRRRSHRRSHRLPRGVGARGRTVGAGGRDAAAMRPRRTLRPPRRPARHDPVDLGPPRRRDLPRRPASWPPPPTAASGSCACRPPPASTAPPTRRRGRPPGSGSVRRWEAAAAMAVLGVAEHRILGLPDGGLADHDERRARPWSSRLLDEVRPDTILTFGPDGDDLPPRPHRRAPLGDRGVGAARPPVPPAATPRPPSSTSPASAPSTRSGACT